MSYAGKIVVVTGAAAGIGRDTALAFAERGATIVALDINGAALTRTAELCGVVGGGPAETHVVDVGDHEAMAAVAKEIETRFGAPDVLVNNAGIGLAGPLLAMTPQDWEDVLHVNLWGVIHGATLFGNQMVARGGGGHIVNVASTAAFLPSRFLGAYATSKSGVAMFSASLRAELADAGIGVSCICPGVINTGIVGTTRFVGLTKEEQVDRTTRLSRLYWLRGYGPQHVANAIVDAVDRDRALVPVSPEAKVMAWIGRFTPRLARSLANAIWADPRTERAGDPGASDRRRVPGYRAMPDDLD